MPIVTKEWLLACFDKLVKVPFENYSIKTSANSTATETPTLPKRSCQRVTRRNASQLIANQAQPENSPLISIQPVTTNQPLAANKLQLPTLSTPHRKEDEKMSKNVFAKNALSLSLNLSLPSVKQWVASAAFLHVEYGSLASINTPPPAAIKTCKTFSFFECTIALKLLNAVGSPFVCSFFRHR